MKFNLFHSKNIKITFLECMKVVFEYMQGSTDDEKDGLVSLFWVGTLRFSMDNPCTNHDKRSTKDPVECKRLSQ